MPQNIILCIERSKNPWEFPEAIANLYMNRFAIDEDAAFEIVDIIRLPGIHKTEKNLLRNAFKKAMFAENLPLPIHITCATDSHPSGRINNIEQLLLEFQIDSVLLTTINWSRILLIDQETTDIMYNEVTNDIDITENSQFNLNGTSKAGLLKRNFLHEDLDLFFQAMHNNEITSFIGGRFDRMEFLKLHFTFTVQKLTKTELSLLEKMDEDYIASFMFYNDQKQTNLRLFERRNVFDVEEMNLSSELKSKSKFKKSNCSRNTVILQKSALFKNLNPIWTRDHQIDRSVHAEKRRLSKKLCKKHKQKKRKTK